MRTRGEGGSELDKSTHFVRTFIENTRNNWKIQKKWEKKWVGEGGGLKFLAGCTQGGGVIRMRTECNWGGWGF